MKTALITGSTKGIGKEIGLDLLDRDYHVIFNGHSIESCWTLKKQLDDYMVKKGDYQIIRADLSYIEEIEKITKYIKNLDVLILNAGITDRTPFGKIALENWNHVLNVNLTNQFFLIQELRNKINFDGKIIFISSISGIVPDAISISYGVSKAAIHMLVLYLAKEFAAQKITVNAIAPGYIMTDWHKNKSKEQLKRIAKKCLAGRLGTPEEVSKAVMAVIDNDFINGQVIRVDGGFIK
jgi:3-oxoacyl-[acyl-carrier protein] reductase